MFGKFHTSLGSHTAHPSRAQAGTVFQIFFLIFLQILGQINNYSSNQCQTAGIVGQNAVLFVLVPGPNLL